MPGMPPQVLCYERADDIGFGVSGVVTRGARTARQLSRSRPDADPHGRAGRGGEGPLSARSDRREPALAGPCALADACIRAFEGLLPFEHEAVELPWSPAFLHKTGGLVLSMGQFMQWVGAQVQSTGTVQIWPGTPVSRSADRGRQGRRRAPARPGCGQARQAGRRLHAGHGHPRGAHRRRRRPGRSHRPATRRAVRPARGPPHARLGAWA